MLNLLSHFAFWVSLLILVALGGLLVWGGKTAYRALVPSGSTTALVAGPGETVCAPVKLSRAERAAVPEIMGRLGEVVLGDGAISRAPEDLEKMGGRTSWLGPDRVDRFDLDGMLLAVQYGGTSEVVRAVSVRLRSPRTLCRALQDVGLLPEQAKFRVDDRGRVFATGGKPAPAFVRGASVQVLVENAGVALVQISAPAE